MPDLCKVSYSHDATIRAFRDYYQFLIDLYMDDAQIIHPPSGGWPSVSPEFQKCIRKTDEVLSLLRNLPYIKPDGTPTHGSVRCYWADWQSLAGRGLVNAVTGAKSLRSVTEGWDYENVPAHVVGLAYGDRENGLLLLDTKLGIVHWPLEDGGGDFSANFDGDPSFMHPISDDADDYAPENELEWREVAPAWVIADVFELLKSQFRKLNWIPTSAFEVVEASSSFGVSLDGMILML